jgi:periplasmic protein TonB
MSNSVWRNYVRLAVLGGAASIGVAAAALAADTLPRVDTTQPRPQEYPDSAQLNGEEGAVLVGVYVRSNGRPSKIRVERSSGYSDLDNAAVESVLNWRFVPATREGDAVADWTTVRILYQLPRLPAQASLHQPG